MPQSHNDKHQPLNLHLGSFPIAQNPFFSVLLNVNATLFQSLATAQKQWAGFVHQRVSEDLAASRELMRSQSPADFFRICSGYWSTLMTQYQEQAARMAEHGQSLAEHLEESAEPSKETTRARH